MRFNSAGIDSALSATDLTTSFMAGAHSLNPFNPNELYLYLKLKELNGDEELEVGTYNGIIRATRNLVTNGRLATVIVEYKQRSTIHGADSKKYDKEWSVSLLSTSSSFPTKPVSYKLPMPFYDLEIQDEV